MTIVFVRIVYGSLKLHSLVDCVRKLCLDDDKTATYTQSYCNNEDFKRSLNTIVIIIERRWTFLFDLKWTI